jgi:hypothetical protein
MNALWWIAGGFLGGIAFMGFLAERKMRRLEDEIREHIGTEDKLRRYGA